MTGAGGTVGSDQSGSSTVLRAYSDGGLDTEGGHKLYRFRNSTALRSAEYTLSGWAFFFLI